MRKMIFWLLFFGAILVGFAHSAFVKLPPKEGVHKSIKEGEARIFEHKGAMWLKLESTSLRRFSKGILEGDEEQESGFESALSSLSIRTQQGKIRYYHHVHQMVFKPNTQRHRLKSVGAYLYQIVDEGVIPMLSRCTLFSLNRPVTLFREGDSPTAPKTRGIAPDSELLLECPLE